MNLRLLLYGILLFTNILIYSKDFKIGNGAFLLNDEPYIIKAAELHYPRIPRNYWEHRIKMVKALGMNTVCMYVFWNVHEAEEGVFDFSGQNDIRAFVELCRDNGLNVILRPGPYVCAEWDMGGLPWWLLKHDVALRTDDSLFLEKVKIFEHAVAQQLRGLTVAEGEPVIMIQVENEYGSYDVNRKYISQIRDILRDEYGSDVEMFQCDWSSNFTLNGLEDLLWTVNFGTGSDIDSEFAELKRLRAHTPLMCSEYWSGWFDKWGAMHETRPANQMTAGIDSMLSKKISFSLYMTHGGTNWSHWAGANSPGYAPDVTSYDYDAPINEQGRATEKYFLLREVLKKYSTTPLAEMPETIPTGEISEFSLTEYAPLLNNLKSFTTGKLQPMEKHSQGYGSIVYRSILGKNRESGELYIKEPHDYAQIFINGIKQGELDRRKNETMLAMPATNIGDTLDIFVEAMGRINFGKAICDYKGITDYVTLNGDTLSEWHTSLFPDSIEFYDRMNYRAVHQPEGAGVYKGSFHLQRPSDTFLDMSGFGKGLVYVNGYGLGRFWNIGPQQTLYLPGCWLKEGENTITVVDIIGPNKLTLQGLETPILDQLNNIDTHRGTLEFKLPDFSEHSPITLNLSNNSTHQKFELPDSLIGRYIAIEINDTYNHEPASIAELNLYDSGGRIDKSNWKSVYVSTFDETNNRGLDKAFDMQESTWWQAKDNTTQTLIIDLGEKKNLYWLEILPAMSSSKTGVAKQINIIVYGDAFTH